MTLLKRKVITLCVSSLLFIHSPVQATEAKQSFSDLSNHWALEYVGQLADQGLLVPLSDDQLFYPEAYITRAQFEFMLTKLINHEHEDNQEQVNDHVQPFIDDDPLSRAEAATILQRAYPNLVLIHPPKSFADVDGVHAAEAEIRYVAQAGLLKGYAEHTFEPDKPLTRAEAAAVISRLLTIHSKENPVNIATVELEERNHLITYIVEPGDSLWRISQRFGTNVDALMLANQLADDRLQIGQVLIIPESVTDGQHAQNLANDDGQDLLPAVDMTGDAGQVELLEWEKASQVLAIGKVAKVTDVYTGESFYIKRFSGANHADVEPLTKNDTRIMNQIWGGPTWNTRPIIVEVDGRRLAAAMHNMPHDVQTITDNDYNGHTCIHFLGSTKHNNGQAWPEMQRDVQIAATYQ